MLFGCERSCSSSQRVSHFNSEVPQGGIYPHMKFERDRLNIFRVRGFTSSGSIGGRGRGDARTIISPNTSFGDINIFICMKDNSKTTHIILPKQIYKKNQFCMCISSTLNIISLELLVSAYSLWAPNLHSLVCFG